MMMTPWTSLVSPSNALPEYPRPQLTRPDWLNLNGLWQFAAADSLGHPPVGQPLLESVLVPYPIESALSRITRYERYMWYRRTVQIPSQWQDRRLQLNFGAVNWQADVWINGHLAGRHFGAYDSFSYDITASLHQGDNELIVGVYSPLESGGIPLGKQRRDTHDIFYTGSSGIWQTVWIEPTNAAHIVALETTPDVPGRKLDLVVQGAGISGQGVQVVVSGSSGPVASVDGSVGAVIHIPIPDARLWTPEDPFLYDLRIALTGPGGGDTVGGYFGMRSISTRLVNGFLRPLLNGEFVFQLGTLDQGFWPDGLYTAPTDDALKFDLQQHKNLGFNTVRKHIKVEPARWYYWADRLGLMVWQDMPSMPVSLPPTGGPPPLPPVGDRSNFERELRRIIDQLRGITSIVQWQPFNESWGAYDRARIAALVKSWDPTRLVDIDSGGWLSLADGTDPIGEPTSIGDCLDDHVYPGPENGAGLPRPPSTTRVAVLGEFGASALIVAGHEWQPGAGFTVTGCPTFVDSAALTQRYVEELEKVRELAVSRGLSAAIYTQLTDVENERNGLWTYDRQVLKVDAEQVMGANLRARTGTAADLTQQHVFYRGAGDSAINHIFWDAPTNQLYFDQWQPNAQVALAPPAAGDPATMVWPRQQHIFYRGNDGAINHIFWDTPTNHLYFDQWQPSAQVPQAPPAAGDPATLAWPNQQHIFYRGNDGAINHIFWDTPTNHLYFDQWQPNPQVAHAPPAAGDPATLVWPDQQHVFYRSATDAINHIFWDAPTNRLYFDQWQPNPQVPQAASAAGDPATLVWPNQQHIFYRGHDGAINHIFWDAPTNRLYFDQWQPNPQVPDAPPAAGKLATLVTPDQQHVFYRGLDGAMNHIFWDMPTNRLYFDQWTVRAHAPLAAGDPATMFTA